MPPQIETGNPTSEGCQPPCKGKELLAAEFISSGSKDTLLCSVEHKIRLMTGKKMPMLLYVQMQVCHTQHRNGNQSVDQLTN
ncbi:MAG: hypothetical protein ABFC90_01925 [Bacteroidales bacterium]|nr:hypothetical protein [Bacteroidales bacterium]